FRRGRDDGLPPLRQPRRHGRLLRARAERRGCRRHRYVPGQHRLKGVAMSSIGANDLVLLINKRTIRNLAISRDHQFEQTVGLGVLALDVASEFIPGAAEWHDRGLEHPDEQTANIAMVVPRLLYATSNNQFGAIPGNSDVEKLLN